MSRLVFGIIAFCFLAAAPAGAETPPVPERKTEALEALQDRLAAERAAQQSREAKAKELKETLDDTRAAMVALAGNIRKNETELTALGTRLDTLIQEEAGLTTRLERDYGSIGHLIMALQKLRRTPPEALIVRPGAPLETAQTAMLMQSILPAISRRAEQLTADLERLEDIRAQVASDREAVIARQNELENERAAMAKLVKEREALYSAADSDRRRAAQQIERMAAEAKNLQDLMAQLEAAEAERRARQKQASREKAAAINTAAVTLPGLGAAQMPASGIVRIGYGQTDAIGAESEGLTIETQPRALVVAPMGGAVRFSGNFKNYGKMVIIEHKKDYHSLIAGFDSVNVQVGDTLRAGEPVGNMPRASSRGGQPSLYYELRQKGRPVNPATVFSGIKS